MVACRPVRAAARRHARVAVAVLAAIVALLGATGAYADQSSETARETLRLRSAGDSLATESRAVVLELYSLETELGQVESRVAALEARSTEVRERERSAQSRLAVVRSSLTEAERRLGDRLRQLYVEGEPDPLGVLLGAESIDEAISTLGNLGRFAEQDRSIVVEVKSARVEVRAALERLERESAEVDALLAEAQSAQAALLQTKADRDAYLDRLRREQRLNEAQLAQVETQAQEAEQKSEEISNGGGGAPSPPPSTSPPGPGRTMVVEATGYALPGTTATGIPVGWGVVAVDPAVIPLGTRMTIPGYGEGVAADTGSAVRGNIIDLWFPTVGQALQWGRRTVTITIH